MPRTRVASIGRAVLGFVCAAGVVVMLAGVVLAHTEREETSTRFEHFLFEECSPCAKESTAIATVGAPAVDLAIWPKTAPPRPARAGEIAVDVVRARVLGRTTLQHLAMRLVTSVASGNAGQLFQLGTGFVDEDEAADLVASLEAIVQAANAQATAAEAEGNLVETALHAGSVRIGVLRLKTDTVAFLQTGDVHALAQRSVFDVASTLFLPVAQLAELKDAVAQAAKRMPAMRAAP